MRNVIKTRIRGVEWGGKESQEGPHTGFLFSHFIKENVMDDISPMTPVDVLNIYQTGQRSGFIAGVAFCFGLKYLYDRRRTQSVYFPFAKKP